MPNEVIQIFECGRCHRQFRGEGAYEAALNCTHGAETIDDLTYPIGTKFVTSDGTVVEVMDKIQFEANGISQAYYKVKWGGRRSKLKHRTIKEYIVTREWKEQENN